MHNLKESLVLKLQTLYESLADDESKVIFTNRLLYSLDNDIKHIHNIFKQLYPLKYRVSTQLSNTNNLIDLILSSKCKNEKIIIFGTGVYGLDIYYFLIESGFSVYSFCDSNKEKQKSTLLGLEIISPYMLVEKHKDSFVVVASQDFEREMYQQLLLAEFPKERIFLSSNFGAVQYFDDNVISHENGEVYLDVGCCNAGTLLDFREWCKDSYKFIYAFEPDNLSFLKCKKVIESNLIKNVELINSGAWSCTDEVFFKSCGSGISTISKTGDTHINVVSIDEVLNGKKVTFIKMDIEGSELEALRGAKNTIINYHPKLAVCIYHKPEDIIEIPLFLKSLVSDYKFYIRHYTQSASETVLYAICK